MGEGSGPGGGSIRAFWGPKGGWRIYVGGVKNIVKNKVFGLVGALWVVKRRLADLCWRPLGRQKEAGGFMLGVLGEQVGFRTDFGPILDRFGIGLGSILVDF